MSNLHVDDAIGRVRAVGSILDAEKRRRRWVQGLGRDQKCHVATQPNSAHECKTESTGQHNQIVQINRANHCKSKPDFVNAGALNYHKVAGSSQINGIVSLQLIKIETAAEKGGVKTFGQNQMNIYLDKVFYSRRMTLSCVGLLVLLVSYAQNLTTITA